MSRTLRRASRDYFRRPATFNNKKLLIAWSEEAKEAEALQASNKAIAKAKALPDVYDELLIKHRSSSEQFAREALSSSCYAKFKLLASKFYSCYGKSLYRLSFDCLFSYNKLEWRMLADKFIIKNLLMLSTEEAMAAINESYAYNCLVLAERFKSWNKSYTLSERIRQWHCEEL